MDFSANQIFTPSTGVDIVFNMKGLAPYSRSSIIYDADYKKHEIVIAQPLTPFSHKTDFKELHLTTIVRDRTRKLRAGVACTGFKLIDNFALANQETVPAVLMRYKDPVIEVNIRSAFRLPLSRKFVIKGKIILDNLEYFSPSDFSIRDISLTGMGLLIPKKKGERANPLTLLKQEQELLVGIILIDTDQSAPSGTLPIKAVVKRIKLNHSPGHALLGLHIAAMKPDNETILNRFIHEAQIDELKRLSGRK